MTTTIKILYVEDHSDSRKAISELLPVIFNCDVSTANNGVDGSIKAINEDFSIVLMDIGLPDISGVEAAKRIRKSKPNQIIIASSGHAYLPEELKELFNASFRKPFAGQLKEFKNFCNSVGIDLWELD